MGNVGDVFVGTNAVERRHLVGRQCRAGLVESPAGMCRANERTLPLGPAEGVQAKLGPMMLGIAAGEHLLAQTKQAQMAGLVRTEAGDLDIVSQQIGKLGDQVILAGEKLLLIVETRSPGQVRADLEILAEAVSHHVRRVDALGGVGVMGAPGGVNVVVARPPAHQCRIDPALHLELLGRVGIGDGDRAALRYRLRAAVKADGVGTAWQFHMLAIGTINLRMKMKVRRKPLGLRRIHAAKPVADFKTGRRRLAVFIKHLQAKRVRRLAVEEKTHLIAKAQVLCPLTHVETELGIALAGVSAVKLHDAILQRQPAERLGERLGIVHRQAKPSIDNLVLR